MANIHPFRPLRYTAAAGALENLVTQPYDTIPPELAARYRAASPYNLVNLILPGTDYAGAASRFRGWVGDGVLARDPAPALYVYEQQFRLPETGELLVRRGFIGLSDTEDYGRTVHRHERTLDAPKADRLALLRNTHAQFGSIFMLYPDAAGTVDALLDGAAASPPLARFTDHQETTQTLWRMDDPEWIRNVQSAIADKPLIIADGHHRYEAALMYRRGKPTMMTFVNLHSAGLRSLAAHRVISGLPRFPAEVIAGMGRPLASIADLRTAWETTPKNRVRFGAALAGGLWLLELERPEGALNLTVLHERILHDVLRISPEATAREQFVGYRRGIETAMNEVRTGKAQAAFLVAPLDVQDVARLALSGQTLPQKSTDFYPKLLSGLTIYDFDD